MGKSKIQELAELMGRLMNARNHSRNLGRMYEYMTEDKSGNLVVDFSDSRIDLSHCPVDWGDVVMCERCRSMIYSPNDEERPLRFIFDYFYDNQSLWVFPERMNSKDIQNIIDWIYKTINY